MTDPFVFQLQRKNGTREQYAPVKYLNLPKEMEELWLKILGSDVFPEVNEYRRKLRNSTRTVHASREMPRFLRCVVTPNDQNSRLQEVGECTLRWNVIEEYSWSKEVRKGLQTSISPL